jgi:hypothetical protein
MKKTEKAAENLGEVMLSAIVIAQIVLVVLKTVGVEIGWVELFIPVYVYVIIRLLLAVLILIIELYNEN